MMKNYPKKINIMRHNKTKYKHRLQKKERQVQAESSVRFLMVVHLMSMTSSKVQVIKIEFCQHIVR